MSGRKHCDALLRSRQPVWTVEGSLSRDPSMACLMRAQTQLCSAGRCCSSILNPATLQDLCGVLAELHDHAPVHSWAESKVAIEDAFGKSVEELFEHIDHEPLASGSVAQVRLVATTAALAVWSEVQIQPGRVRWSEFICSIMARPAQGLAWQLHETKPWTS